jgi:hypothetical protein
LEFYRHFRRRACVVPPKSFGSRHVTITLDRTRHEARPLLLVISRLVIDAGGSVTQSTGSFHSRDPRIVVGSAGVSRSNEVTMDRRSVLRFLLVALLSFSTLVSTHASNWTEGAFTGSTQEWRGITSSSDGTKLAAVADLGNIWTSSDSGATWTENTFVGRTVTWYAITSSSDGTKLAAVDTGGNIWTSTNSGATWTEDMSVGSTKPWKAITSSSDGTNLASVVHGGNIWTFSAPSPPPPPPRPCTCCERSMKSFGFSVGAEDCDPEL